MVLLFMGKYSSIFCESAGVKQRSEVLDEMKGSQMVVDPGKRREFVSPSTLARGSFLL